MTNKLTPEEQVTWNTLKYGPEYIELLEELEKAANEDTPDIKTEYYAVPVMSQGRRFGMSSLSSIQSVTYKIQIVIMLINVEAYATSYSYRDDIHRQVIRHIESHNRKVFSSKIEEDKLIIQYGIKR